MNEYGLTALHLASEQGHVAAVQALLEHEMCDTSITNDDDNDDGDARVWVDANNEPGRTALHLAADWGHESVVQALLDHWTCNISITDCTGKTALHLAAWGGEVAAVQALLEDAKCDTSITTSGGCTAADWARAWGHGEVAIMIDAMKRPSEN